MNENRVPCSTCAFMLSCAEDLRCPQCGHKNPALAHKSADLCLAFSLTALIFYIPANLLSFMTFEMYGNVSSSTIYSGIISLYESGSYLVALVVFLASILLPLLKLLILFYLSLSGSNSPHPRFKTALYRFVEAIGRWSMLDIFLLAVLVGAVKFGKWGTVIPELGSAFFVLVVIFTMLASSYFDPKIIWEEKGKQNVKL